MNKKIIVTLLVVASLLVGNLFVINAQAAKKSNTYYRYISAKCSTMKFSRFRSYSKSFGKGKIKFYKMVRKDKVSCGNYSSGLDVFCSYQHAQSSIKPKDMNDVKYYPHDIEDLASFQPYAKKRVKNGSITRESLANHIRGILVNTTPYLSVDEVRANFTKWCKNNSNCNKKLKKNTINASYINDVSIVRAASQIAIWSYANGDAAHRSVKCDSCKSKEVATANEMYDYFRTLTATNSNDVKIKGANPIENNGKVIVTFTVTGNTLTGETFSASCKATNGTKLPCSVEYNKNTNKGTLTVKNPEELPFRYVVTLNGYIRAVPVAYIPYETSCSKKNVCVKKNKKGKCTKHQKKKVCSEHVTKHQEYVGEPSADKINITEKLEKDYVPEKETLNCKPTPPKDVTCLKDKSTSSEGNVLDKSEISTEQIKNILSATTKKYTNASIKACQNQYCKKEGNDLVCCSTKLEVDNYNGGKYSVLPPDPDNKDKLSAGGSIVFNRTNGTCDFARIKVTKTCYVKKANSCPSESSAEIKTNTLAAKLRIAMDKDWKEIALNKTEKSSDSKCEKGSTYSYRTSYKTYSFRLDSNSDDENVCYKYDIPKVPDTAAFIDIKIEYDKDKSTSENKSCMLPKGATCKTLDPCLKDCPYVKELGGRCAFYSIEELKQHCKCPSTDNDPNPTEVKTFDLKNVYYRTIDTENIFPSGRKATSKSIWYQEATGANTAAATLLSEADGKIQLSQAAYSGNPVYTVTLTPEQMKAIRENNSAKGNSYTTTGGLQNFINEISSMNSGKDFMISGTGGNN